MDFLNKIDLAFHPASEIRDPTYFIGRKNEISDAIKALRETGSFLSIWGNRGVGKSSIARQIQIIAEGKNNYLPKQLGLQRLLPEKGFNFITHMVFCDKFTKNIQDLIGRIVQGDQHSPSLFTYTKDGERLKKTFEKSTTINGGFNTGIAKIDGHSEEKQTYESSHSSEIIQQFKTLLGQVRANNQNRTGLLIIIDEFDVLHDISGFSSLIKSCSDNFIKFCIAGISSDLRALLGDHASITRQIRSIKINSMTSEELGSIIDRTENIIQPYGFETSLIEEITKMSEGFPYFVHLLGRECALCAFENNTNTDFLITKKHLEEVLQSLKAGRLAPVYEELYQVGVKHSPQRELLLRAFADSPEEEISTGAVYTCVQDLGVTNPSQLMKELTAPVGFEPILIEVRDRCYRFADPVFRTYVKLRDWKF